MRCSGVEECDKKYASLWNASFEMALCRCCVPKSCRSFAFLDLVCSKLSDSVMHGGVYEIVTEFLYIHSV